jgi:O-antigen ligase
LAWAWHHRISRRPFGSPPSPFREFRFNDHLVWGAIFTLGLLLVSVPAPVPAIAANLMVLWVGLYAVRGLAVLAALLAQAPMAFKAFAAVFAVLLVPVTVGACLAIGLADTWLDIRRRMTPPAPGGA